MTVPYGGALAEAIPAVDIRLQRDLNAVLQLVRAHALLHEETRERDERGRLVATLKDYATVRELVHDLLSESAEQTVPPTVRETVNAMTAMGPASQPDEKGLSITQISYKLKVSRSQVSRRLKRAESLGFVAESTGAKSGKPKRFVIGERVLGADEELLPTVERLEELCRCARTGGEGHAPEDDGR